MQGATFHHFGVPTTSKQPGETYLEGGKVYVTDPTSHPYQVEFVRFEADSPMPKLVQNKAHAAFTVPNLNEAIKGRKVIIDPFDATPTIRVAFITDGDAVIELMEIK